MYEFDWPSDLCGMLIGRNGRTVNSIRENSGAEICIRNKPYSKEYQICAIEGI